MFKVTSVAFIAIAMLAAMSARAAPLATLLVLPLDMVDTSGETPSRAKEHEVDRGDSIDTTPGRMQWLRTGPRQAASRRSRVGGTDR